MEQLTNLTDEQLKALEQGKEVRIVHPQTKTECVVIRADVFAKIKQLLPEFDPRETYSAADDVMREDWSDPKMAEYDDYEARRP